MCSFARCLAAAMAVAVSLLALPAPAGAMVVEGGTLSVPRAAARKVEQRALERDRVPSRQRCPRPASEKRVGRVLLADSPTRPA